MGNVKRIVVGLALFALAMSFVDVADAGCRRGRRCRGRMVHRSHYAGHCATGACATTSGCSGGSCSR